MSERSIPNRIPGTRENSRPPNPSPPQRRRRTPTPTPRRSKPLSKPNRILQRCKSEPILWTVGPVYGNETQGPRFDFILFRPKTCTDVFVSPLMSPPSSNSSFEKLKKDAKVVVNVTVEGSPGPVRTLVRLGASVEETIRLVVDKYSDEGRTPRLSRKAAFTEFELHHSHFSLESIKKTDTIGDIGSRSFYLRKSSSSGHRSRRISTTDDDEAEAEAETQKLAITYSAPEIVPCSSTPKTITTAHAQDSSSPLLVFLPEFLVRKIAKLGRRTRRIWNILGCL